MQKQVPLHNKDSVKLAVDVVSRFGATPKSELNYSELVKKLHIMTSESLGRAGGGIRLFIKNRKNDTRWDIDSTPLCEQAKPLSTNPESHLKSLALDARKNGKTVKLLIFGMGKGSPDLADFLEHYSDCVEFHGTTLMDDSDAVPSYYKEKHNVHYCNVTDALGKIKERKFDIIISHFSTHGYNLAAIDVFWELLKPGGELVMVGPDTEMPTPYAIRRLCKPFSFIEHAHDSEPRDLIMAQAYHLRKIDWLSSQ